MGWMHDTLNWFQTPVAERGAHREKITFGLHYAQSERFVAPLSHDEVVHGKAPLIYKCPGDEDARFAQLRLLLAWQWLYPAKKLLFMGNEFGDTREWDASAALSWDLPYFAPHGGVLHLVGELNRMYRAQPALYARELEAGGFEWLDCEDPQGLCFSFARHGGDQTLVAAFNGGDQPRDNYHLKLPRAGVWRELLNTDSVYFAGQNRGNNGFVVARRDAERRAYANVLLPPFTLILLRHDS